MKNSLKRISINTYRYIFSLIILTQVNTIKQYKNSFLGSAWGLVQPCIHIAIISYFFGFLLGQGKEKILLNLVATLPFWTFLQVSLTISAQSLISRDHIIRKCVIPKTLFPLSDIAVSAYNLLLSFIVMYFIVAIIFPKNFTFLVFLTPFYAIPLLVSVISISVAVSYLTPYIRDIPQMLIMVLNAVYWTIPIIYPYEMIPESKKILFELNPLFLLFRPMQILLTLHEIPSTIIILKAVAIMLLSVALSYTIYKACRKNVVFYL